MTRVIDLSAIDCISYARVSTEEQASEKQTSLADQDRALTTLATTLGRSIGHRFVDRGLSGATIEHRPDMRALVASCKAHPKPRGKEGYVLVLNDSRWGRFQKSEHATYWRVEVELVGWLVRFAEMDDTQDDAVRPILRALAQSQASLYRRNLQTNVLRGCRGQAEQGYWQAKAPFGYLRFVTFPPGRERTLENHIPKATDEKLILVPHQDEAPIVQAAFARYVAGGESLASLLEWAQTAYPSKQWTRAAMLRLLTNPAYVGDVVWGRVAVEPGQRAARTEAEWYGKRDAHVALVDRRLFEAAQHRLGSNRQRTRGVRSDWILSGIVRCRCGRGLVGAGATGPNGANPVYACTTRSAHAQRRCDYKGAVMKTLLEASALELLTKEIGAKSFRRSIERAADRVLAAWEASRRPATAIARELATVRQQQQRLVSAIAAGTLTAADAAERMKALRRDQDALESEQRSAQQTVDRSTWRDEMVRQAADFGTMAATLKGPALREVIQQWVQRAEFNTTTRELTMEIRRIPAVFLGGFATEGEPSSARPNKRTSGLDATITRSVIVGRRRSA